MENANFTLETLPYERVSIEEFKTAITSLIDRLKNSKSGEEQFEVHKSYYQLMNRFNTNYSLANVRHDGNVKDEFYQAEMDYYDEIIPEVQVLDNEYSKILLESPYRDYLEGKIGKVAFKNIEFALKAFSDKVISLAQEENALTTEYGKLYAEVKFLYNGEELNLSLVGKYLTDGDRNIRIDATKARSAALEKIKDKLDEIYDKLVKNRTEQAKLLGFNNYVELGYYRMGRTTYDINDVHSFKEQVKKYLVPLATKIHEQRRKRLGVDVLDSVDEGIYFDYGNPKPQGTPDDIFAAGKKMYSELSPETGEFFNFMLEHDLFDVLGRTDKAGGGFMDMLPLYKAPLIFANFNGTSGDVDVITHECGHAFQYYVNRDEKINEFNDIKMETAETHSMSMEFFTAKWAELFFGDKSDDFRKLQLEDAIAFIPYGTMVDEYQEQVYLHPEYTPAERNKLWQDLEKTFKPHLNYANDEFNGEGRRWQTQKHIYESPFYYIDYCLAQTCALQFKALMEEDYDKAWNDYLAFCKLSARDTFENMLHEVGLKCPFDEGYMEELVSKIEKML